MHWQKRGPELRYDVIMQPSSQPWLFALDVAQTDQTDTRLMSDFHLQRRQPVEQRLFYRASSWPQALRESSIDPRMRWRNLQLPMHGNRARAPWPSNCARPMRNRRHWSRPCCSASTASLSPTP